MAKKKKKKKKASGARRPTYAQGKKVEAASPARKPAAQKQGAAARGGGAAAQAGGEQRQQWNLVRKGSLEAKIMWVLLAIIVVAALARYPLTTSEADSQHRDLTREYKERLKAWEDKYKTPEERKEHEKDKPVEPKKPTTNVILMSVLFGALQSAIFAFLGLNILRRTDLGTPLLDKTLSGDRPGWPDLRPFLTWSLPAGVLMLAPLYVNARISENIVNMVFKPAEKQAASYPLWQQVLGSLNDGVFYFVLFVFVAVSGLLWVLARYRDRTRVEPHWGAIAGAFVLSAAFVMLNITSAGAADKVSAWTQALYAAALAVPVVPLGYVLWKKGLEYALLAGLLGFALYPVMASFVIT